MKKSLLFLAALLSAFVLVSCSSDDDSTGGGGSTDQKESWTIMFYSVGGGNLDSAQVGNMAEAFLANQSEKINMTFEFKFSKAIAPKVSENLQGCFRYDMAENRNNIDATAMSADKTDPKWMFGLSTEKVANEDMAAGTSLAEFIKWSKQKHPADHYMLILSDHGAGFDLEGDAAESRSILVDDTYDDSRQLSLDNTVSGISAGMGGNMIDAIYTDACLMQTVENLYAYSDVSKAYLGAEELTPGVGGDYTCLLNNIAANSTDFKAAAKAYIDQVVGTRWKDQGCADLGYYDLTQMETLIAPIKSLEQELMGTNGIQSNDASVISKIKECVSKSQVAQSNYYSGVYLDANDYPAVTEGAKAITKHQTGDGEVVTLGDCQVYMLGQNDDNNVIKTAIMGNPTSPDQTIPANIKTMIDNCGKAGTHQVTLAYFMMGLAEELGGNYKTICENYVNALNNCTYLKNTQDATKYAPALFSSMSINMINLSQEGILQGQGTTIDDFCTYTQDEGTGAITITGFKPVNVSQYYTEGVDAATKSSTLNAVYKRTKFDKAVNWSEFLNWSELPNPGLFSNPSFEQTTGN